MNTSTIVRLLKKAMRETINVNPLDTIHDHSSGSIFKDTLNAGYGAIIIYLDIHPDNNQRILIPRRQCCANYTAEITAIEKKTFAKLEWTSTMIASHQKM
jgi:hypothetical protein